MPRFSKVVQILCIIPVTSFFTERSFSALRRLKNYSRSTMIQDRLSTLALLSIERAYGNKVMNEQMEKVNDKFVEKKRRLKYFF